MGGRLVPPIGDLISPLYARDKISLRDVYWRNILENPTTVQFDHRVLASTTFLAIGALHALTLTKSYRPFLPPATVALLRGTFHMSIVQVALGISTLVYLVPTPLAAMHQAGSLVLLTLTLLAGLSLRRPSAAARAWLRAHPGATRGQRIAAGGATDQQYV